MHMQALKVLVVEDSSVLAQRMEEALIEIPEIYLVGVVDTESAAREAIQRQSVHVVFLDLHLREGTGFGILRAIADMHRKPRVVVLTNHASVDFERDAVAMGATYFLDKARDFHRLPAILQEIVRNEGLD